MTEKLQEDLRTFFAKAKVPSSPALAAKILEIADDPNATVEDFARLIQMDPSLSARLLRMTNSAAFGQRSPVTTIQRAVSLLGISRVRTVSLGFQLTSHLDRLGKCPFDVKAFWRQSVLRGCLARAFTEVVASPYADEAFLVGLLQDCGVLLLVQFLGKPYADLCQAGLSPSAFYNTEKCQFPYDHVQTITTLAREWKLPEVLINHLERQHTATPLTDASPDADRVSAVSYLVGSVRMVGDLTVDDNEPALTQYATSLGLHRDVMSNCFRQAAETYGEMAQLLSGIVPEDLDVTDLLGEANAHLTATMESERDQTIREQAHLKSALGEYRERAACDPLTGILNRGALMDALQNSLEVTLNGAKSLAIFFLDIDNFKNLNDTYGHQTGDQVLKALAQILRDHMRNAGVVGRWGGEEFLLASLGLTESAARELSASVVAAVRGMPFSTLGLPSPVTCSLGAVWGVFRPDITIEQLVHAADELMYEAKRAGKDQHRFRAFDSQDCSEPIQSDNSAISAYMALFGAVAGQPGGATVVPEEYQRIAKRLAGFAPKQIVDMRKQERKDLMLPCRFTFLVPETLELVADDAFVWNISTGGIGLLTSRRVPRGHAAEVAVSADGEPHLYVAGIVAHSRHVEGVVHQVGMQLFAHADQPILSADPISAIQNLDWITSALRSLQPVTPARTLSNRPAVR